MIKDIENANSDLDFGNWKELVDNPNQSDKKESKSPKQIFKEDQVSSEDQENSSNKLIILKTDAHKNNKNNKFKKIGIHFKRISKFNLDEQHFITNESSANKIHAQILAKEDFDLINKFKKSWFFFIPIVGLILFIWITNRMFRSFKLIFSKKVFDDNGLSIMNIIGFAIAVLMFATITTFLVCVFLLGLFNGLSGTDNLINFIISIFVLVVGFFLLIDYFFVNWFLFYIHPKVKKNYEHLLEKVTDKIEWNNPSSILEHLDPAE